MSLLESVEVELDPKDSQDSDQDWDQYGDNCTF